MVRAIVAGDALTSASGAVRIAGGPGAPLVTDGPYAEVSSNPLVIEAYMGTVETTLQGAH